MEAGEKWAAHRVPVGHRRREPIGLPPSGAQTKADQTSWLRSPLGAPPRPLDAVVHRVDGDILLSEALAPYLGEATRITAEGELF